MGVTKLNGSVPKGEAEAVLTLRWVLQRQGTRTGAAWKLGQDCLQLWWRAMKLQIVIVSYCSAFVNWMCSD